MPKKPLKMNGGYAFQGFLGTPTKTIEMIPAGETVRIPICDAVPAVNTGDTVSVGQVIAEADDGPFRVVVGSAAGTVEAAQDAFVQINLGGDQTWNPNGSSGEWENLAVETIEDVLLNTGTCAVAEGGLPTRHETSSILPGWVKRVVIHDNASEVYAVPAEALLSKRLLDLAEGISILKKLYASAEIHVVVAKELAETGAALESSGATVHIGSPKYPQHHPAVIMASLFGTAIDAHTKPADSGAVVLDIQAVLQIRDAIVTGKPFIERTIALAGPGYGAPTVASVRIGTAVSEIAGSRVVPDRSPRIIYNSVMTGVEAGDEAVVGHDCAALIALLKSPDEFLPFASPGFRKDSITLTFVNSFLRLPKSLDDNLHGERRACVGCGYCADVCPADILPWHLHRFVERKIIDESLMRYGAFRCIECNLCSYVCVSKIPLAELIKDGKQALIEEGYASPVTSQEDAE